MRRRLRRAIYNRKSIYEGLDQAFNSLDARGEPSLYCKSGRRRMAPSKRTFRRWRLFGRNNGPSGTSKSTRGHQCGEDRYDRRLQGRSANSVDRLTRSLADFARIVELFDANNVSFVSITQQFSTTTSMGRLIAGEKGTSSEMDATVVQSSESVLSAR